MKFLLKLVFCVCSVSVFAQNETGLVQLKDAEIYYKVYGSGFPVLLINGGPGFSSAYLDSMAQMIAVNKKVILYDQRGTGNSKVDVFTKRSITLSKNISDIDALRKHLRIEYWDIIGHAYGGALGMMYAHKYPHRTRKLVLSSSIGLNLEFVEPMMANLKLRLNIKEMSELSEKNQAKVRSKNGDSESFYKQRFDLITDAYVYDKSKIQMARDSHKQPNDYTLEVNQIIWDEMQMRDYDISNKMKEYQGEVLILHGRQDVIGESVPYFTHLTLPNSTLVFINKAGRYLWLDQPDDYFYHLNKFLQ